MNSNQGGRNIKTFFKFNRIEHSSSEWRVEKNACIVLTTIVTIWLVLRGSCAYITINDWCIHLNVLISINFTCSCIRASTHASANSFSIILLWSESKQTAIWPYYGPTQALRSTFYRWYVQENVLHGAHPYLMFACLNNSFGLK